MPPKKDEKKKGAEEPPQDDGAERELVEKELAIGYLKSKLGRYQEFGDKLHFDNIRLNEELETQKLNLRDINEFLTNELKARSLTSSALEAKVYEMTQQMEEASKKSEEAMAKLRQDKDEEISELESRIQDYEKKMRQTQDFLERKDILEAELLELKKTLDTKMREFKQQMTDIDRQHIQDREKWKRETATKIKETKIAMMKLTDNQLEMTTKRTIMENEQMSLELAYQSRQTEKLLARTGVLGEENSDLRRQLSLSKQTEQELAKRNNVYQKTIKSLLTKLKEQGVQHEESGVETAELETKIADMESAVHLSQLQVDDMEHRLAEANTRLKDRTAQLDAWTNQHDQAMRFLMTCLKDVQSKIVTIERPADDDGYGGGDIGSGGGGVPGGAGSYGSNVTVLQGQLEDLDEEQRERVLAHLIERLQAFTRTQQLEAATSSAAAQQQPHQHRAGPARIVSMHSVRSGVSGAGGLSLPHIPSFPRSGGRRSPGGGGSGGISAVSSIAHGRPGALTRSLDAGAASSDGGGGGPVSPLRSSMLTGGGAAGGGAADEPLPPVDDLLARVMSDVRPWGKRTAGTAGTSPFLKKGIVK